MADRKTMYIHDVDEDLLVDSSQRWFQGLENLLNMEVFLSYFVKYWIIVQFQYCILILFV